MQIVKKTVYSVDECRKLQAEGYKLESLSYWNGSSVTTFILSKTIR